MENAWKVERLHAAGWQGRWPSVKPMMLDDGIKTMANKGK
jgi:hypothetical protein